MTNFRGGSREPDDIEKFHNLTRDVTVICTFLLPLGCLAYFGICKFRRKQDTEQENSASASMAHSVDDDAFASRFVILASTMALTVSQGAILLLPFSVLANEIVHSYPGSYYFQWLSSSLVHGLWNLISLFSNISLVTLVFAYFLSESEGFDGSRKGLYGRVKEALVTIIFVLIFLFGAALLLYHFLSYDTWDFISVSNLRKLHLPWMYTCLSFIGAAILLISTPYGYARMFSIVARLVKRPLLPENVSLESVNVNLPNSIRENERAGSIGNESAEELKSLLEEQFGEHLNPSFFRRTLLYPLLMLLMMLWTAFCILVCFVNLALITIGLRDLPGVSRLAEVGITSLSHLGMLGAILEILIIGYTVVAFLVGFYSLPGMGRLMPQFHDTSLPQIVANCALILLLSSALPLFVRVLGITNFDLVGNFASISWLRNLRVIVGYNIAYLVASVSVLAAHVSKTVWYSICQRLKIGTHGIKKVAQSNSALKERFIDPYASKLLYLSAKNGYLKKQN